MDMALRLASLVLLTGLTAGSQVWNPREYPNPTKDLESCGRRGVRSWVCDPDGVISYESANFVEGTISKIAVPEAPYASSPCGESDLHGYQIAVALLQEFRVPFGKDAADEAESFARHLHDTWGVGLSSCNNGVLLFVSIKNRQVFISTGKSAAVLLTDTVLDTIIDNMRPELRQSKYKEAVEKAVVEIGLALAGKPVGAKENKDGGSWTPVVIFMACTAGLVAVMSYFNARKAREFKAAASHLERLKADQRAAMDGKYISRACPICLEEFTMPQAADAAARELKPLSAEAGAESIPLLSSQEAAGPSTSAGAGPEASGSGAGSTGRTSQQRKPLVLGCGHGFCEACIAEWLKKKTNCPICRQSIGPESRSPPPGPSMDPQRRQQAQDVTPELAFRLHSLRRRYPGYITRSMVETWDSDLQANRELSPSVMRDFQLRDPTLRQETTHRGSGGSSSSFGGGHSSGGRGGSW